MTDRGLKRAANVMRYNLSKLSYSGGGFSNSWHFGDKAMILWPGIGSSYIIKW